MLLVFFVKPRKDLFGNIKKNSGGNEIYDEAQNLQHTLSRPTKKPPAKLFYRRFNSYMEIYSVVHPGFFLVLRELFFS